MADRGLDLAHGVETAFRRIEKDAMAGMPMLNSALRVEVVGMAPSGEEWICVLITPWFMNLMLLPGGATPAAPVGAKSVAALPGGRFEFIAGHDDSIGPYRLCSLFSPMFDFADQEAAVATAREILGLVTTAQDAADADKAMTDIWEGRLPAPEPVAAIDEAHTSALSRRRLFGLPATGGAAT